MLDIGGWGRPFNRADHVIDSEPFETRGVWYRENFGWSAQGGDVEHFTKETWLQRDICDREPWPYADKQFDFCICSHTLEDIRDPLGVCSEIIRVAKAGYIEIPSRLWEQCRGQETNIVGLSHHRWLIEILNKHIRFVPKYHAIHGNYRRNFPVSFLEKMLPEDRVTWMFWEDAFTFEEVTIHGVDAMGKELSRFVSDRYSYSPTTMIAEAITERLGTVSRLPRRAYRKIVRTIRPPNVPRP